LAFAGLMRVQKSLRKAFYNPSDLDARSDMAYSALISGITLAHAGLGTIHGFASSIAANFDIPHGVICGTLLGEVNKFNVNALASSKNIDILEKYISLGRLFSNVEGKPNDYYIESFVESINKLVEELGIPRLGTYGLSKNDVTDIVKRTSNKNNPVELVTSQLEQILMNRI
jgi:alcohol dehydrogenase class IV